MLSRTVESGVQLFSRTKQKAINLDGIKPSFFPDGGPLGGQVIEINITPDIDYTDIVVDFITRAILPKTLCEEFRGIEVILFNTDFQISLLKVIKSMEKKLEPFNLNNEKKVIIEESLKRLIILNCYSIEQFEVTIYRLESIIGKFENTGLIIIDNILSQYWCARFNNVKLSFEEHASKMLSLVYDRIKEWNVVLMYTKLITGDLKRTEKSQIVTYSIDVIKNKEEYTANIKNFEKNNCISVSFKGF